MIMLMLGAFTSLSAQDNSIWNYKVNYIRYGKSSGDGIAALKENVRWDEWRYCDISVHIDLDEQRLIVSDGDSTLHVIDFTVLDARTDNNSANLLLGGFDICRMDLASADWYLYKGQNHNLYLFYEGDVAIQLSMKAM